MWGNNNKILDVHGHREEVVEYNNGSRPKDKSARAVGLGGGARTHQGLINNNNRIISVM
jgi:hypothetical protein